MNLRSSLTGVLLLTFVVSAVPASAGDRKHSKHFHKEAEVAAPPPAEPVPVPVQSVEAPPPPPPVVVEHKEEDDWYVNLEAYYIEPKFSGNPAFLVHADDSVTDFHFQRDFSHDTDFAPKITIGGGDDGHVGFQMSAFTFNQSADPARVTDDGTAAGGANSANQIVQSAAPMGLGFYSTGTQATPTIVTAGSKLGLDTYDLEATWKDHTGRIAWFFSGGARYADMDQRYTANERVAATGVQRSNVISLQDFQGVGPTASAKGSVRLGDSGAALYGMGRGSLLFGDGEQIAILGVTPVGATTRSIFTNRSNADDVIPVAEMEVGAEFKRDWHEHTFKFSLGVMAQNWFGAGNAAGSETLVPRAGSGGTITATAPTSPGGTATVTGAVGGATAGVPTRQFDVDAGDNDGNLGLVGLKVAASITF